MSQESELLFAGDGHGAVAALTSLQECFFPIFVLTTDDNVRSAMRPMDREVVDFIAVDTVKVVCAGYKAIIKKDVLSQKDILNVHYSLLPKYRGYHGTVWAILNRESQLGYTVHKMNEYVDDGPIVFQYAVANEGQTSWQFMECFDDHVRRHLGKVAADYFGGLIKPRPQDKCQATWVGRRSLDDCLLDFNSTCEEILLMFRALVAPYPLPRISVKGEGLEIIESHVVHRPYDVPVGRVLNIDGEGAWVRLRDGFLVLRQLRDTDGKVVEATSVLKLGQRLSRG